MPTVGDLINGVTSIAKTIDMRMKTLHKTGKPQLIQLMPEDEHIDSSTKYFLGNLGLFNTYPFSTIDIFKIKEGVRRRYRPGYDIFIINYTDDLACSERFHEASHHFSQSPRYRNFQFIQEAACFEDKKGRLIFIRPYKSDIIIISGARSCKDAEKIIKKVQDGKKASGL